MVKVRTNIFHLTGAELNAEGRIVNLRYSGGEAFVKREGYRKEYSRPSDDIDYLELSQLLYDRGGDMFKKSVKIPRNVLAPFQCIGGGFHRNRRAFKAPNRMNMNNVFRNDNSPSKVSGGDNEFSFFEDEDDFKNRREFTSLVHKVNGTGATKRRVTMLESEINSEQDGSSHDIFDGRNTRIHFRPNCSPKGISSLSKKNKWKRRILTDSLSPLPVKIGNSMNLNRRDQQTSPPMDGAS
ncbi:uncharacterized protein isoform X2 [Rhodnius prolixus]|uniref:uncharacterized protein isoform X2 n=1 Tax=Rhodnius prolixus TaxID=13249 RepID=UPI003D18B507